MSKEQLNVQNIQSLVARAIQSNMSAKQASQYSPASDNNAERPASSEPSVDPKLQNTGEGYAQPGLSAFGRETQQDVIRNQPNNPAAEKEGVKANTDAALDRITADGVQDGIQSAGDPTTKVVDPQNASSEPDVDEKLQLKNAVAELRKKTAEVFAMGQEIIDYCIAAEQNQPATANKIAAAKPAAVYTEQQLIDDAAKLATADSDPVSVKQACLAMAERAVLAADAVALLACMEKQAEGEDVVDPAAAAAMQEPAPGGEGEGIPPADEEALMAASLAENGVPPEVLMGDPAGGDLAAGDPAGGEAAVAPMEGEAIDPEAVQALEQFLQEMAAQGIPPEEVAEAFDDIEGEGQVGVTPEEGAASDEEAEKTGHYKFASFIERPRNKTAEQEQRAAYVRRYARDFVHGPSKKDFN